ncbi:hypothetical protein DXV38_25070 [Escherichia albertii]|uniref:YlcI/YnfO family protein n=1 Tax=Escherichia albertii TaxID=208962 RepID=UPI000F674DE0|nr:YlcI/YnfO family protein [Escherichia albertii]EFO1271187.1 hypothetical protein [Escherichia albertii]MCZ8804394.1 hypothetical protein [Escherichia albertii]MCZ9060789.1 hypothetical protein [Escherichia albertii]
MAVDNVNSKSQKMSARVPHDVANSVEELKEPGESTAQFIVTSLQGEIKRRQRRNKQDTPQK